MSAKSNRSYIPQPTDFVTFRWETLSSEEDSFDEVAGEPKVPVRICGTTDVYIEEYKEHIALVVGLQYVDHVTHNDLVNLYWSLESFLKSKGIKARSRYE